jgi:hypothetical protein
MPEINPPLDQFEISRIPSLAIEAPLATRSQVNFSPIDIHARHAYVDYSQTSVLDKIIKRAIISKPEIPNLRTAPEERVITHLPSEKSATTESQPKRSNKIIDPDLDSLTDKSQDFKKENNIEALKSVEEPRPEPKSFMELHTFDFKQRAELPKPSYIDKIKLGAERLLGVPISWSPLSPPLPAESADITRMSWKCVSRGNSLSHQLIFGRIVEHFYMWTSIEQ